MCSPSMRARGTPTRRAIASLEAIICSVRSYTTMASGHCSKMLESRNVLARCEWLIFPSVSRVNMGPCVGHTSRWATDQYGCTRHRVSVHSPKWVFARDRFASTHSRRRNYAGMRHSEGGVTFRIVWYEGWPYPVTGHPRRADEESRHWHVQTRDGVWHPVMTRE